MSHNDVEGVPYSRTLPSRLGSAKLSLVPPKSISILVNLGGQASVSVPELRAYLGPGRGVHTARGWVQRRWAKAVRRATGCGVMG